MKPDSGIRLSLVTRWSALVATLLTFGIALALVLDHYIPGRPFLVGALCLACVVPIAVMVGPSVVSAMAASALRSVLKRTLNSVAMCWESAALPPLPKNRSLPPFDSDTDGMSAC